MRIWKPIGIAATIISLGCSMSSNFKDVCEGQQGSALERCVSETYGTNVKDYQALKTQSFPMFSSCQGSGGGSPPAQQQPPAPQHYLLETWHWDIDSDECSVSQVDRTVSADYSISADANCVSSLGGNVQVNFGIKNLTDGVVLNDVIGVISKISDPSVTANYPTAATSTNYPLAVTSTGCDNPAGCPYFVSGDITYKNPVTKTVEFNNPTGDIFRAQIDWYNKK